LEKLRECPRWNTEENTIGMPQFNYEFAQSIFRRKLENDNTYLVSVANPEREDVSIIFFEEDRTLIMSELTSNEAVVL
ncbi:MAG: hypothetical protein ABI477_24590, partial [Chryseolinea sp.]